MGKDQPRRGGQGGVNTRTLPFGINTAGKKSPPYPKDAVLGGQATSGTKPGSPNSFCHPTQRGRQAATKVLCLRSLILLFQLFPIPPRCVIQRLRLCGVAGVGRGTDCCSQRPAACLHEMGKNHVPNPLFFMLFMSFMVYSVFFVSSFQDAFGHRPVGVWWLPVPDLLARRHESVSGLHLGCCSCTNPFS